MKYTEVYGDLFTAVSQPSPLILAHCISVDAALGAGIAAQFRDKYPDMVQKLQHASLTVGTAYFYPVQTDFGIANLITKKRYYQKPSYQSLQQSLVSLRILIQKKHIKTLAIPAIGSGLDRLSWPHVKSLLNEVFNDVDVDIIVYLR